MRECRTWPERGFPGYSQRAWWTDRPGVVFPGVSATGSPSVVRDARVHRRCAGLPLPRMLIAMLRLTRAPNLALARLWADALGVEGIGASVQREFLAGVAGQLPPDQCLPEIWIDHPEQEARARQLLHDLQHVPQQRWRCACGVRFS